MFFFVIFKTIFFLIILRTLKNKHTKLREIFLKKIQPIFIKNFSRYFGERTGRYEETIDGAEKFDG